MGAEFWITVFGITVVLSAAALAAKLVAGICAKDSDDVQPPSR